MSENAEQWVPMDFRVVDSQWFDKTSGEIVKFYIILRRYVCRARTGHSLSDFYRKGMLVTAGSSRTWAEKMGKSHQTIGRYLSYLEDTRAIHIYRKARHEAEATIVVLGRVIWTAGSEKATELFFLDHLSQAQEPVEELPCVTGNELGLIHAEMNGILGLETLNDHQWTGSGPSMDRQNELSGPPMDHRIYKSNREEKYLPPQGGGDLDPLIVTHNLDDVVFRLEDTGLRKEEMTAQCPRCNATHSQQMNLCPDCGAHVIWFQSPTWKRLYGSPDAYRRKARGEDLKPRTSLQVYACQRFGSNGAFANVSQQRRFKRLEKAYPDEYLRELIAWATDKNSYKGFDAFESAANNPDALKRWETRNDRRETDRPTDPGTGTADQEGSVADEWARWIAGRAETSPA